MFTSTIKRKLLVLLYLRRKCSVHKIRRKYWVRPTPKSCGKVNMYFTLNQEQALSEESYVIFFRMSKAKIVNQNETNKSIKYPHPSLRHIPAGDRTENERSPKFWASGGLSFSHFASTNRNLVTTDASRKKLLCEPTFCDCDFLHSFCDIQN